MGGASDNYRFGRSAFYRNCQGGQPDRAGTLNDDSVSELDVDALNAVQGCVEGAAGADDRLKWDVVWKLENRGSGAEQDPLAVTSSEVRSFVATV